MPNIDMNHVAQSYVYSAYKTTSMIRFFYFPNKHNSVAYKIDNNDRLVQRRTSKKHWRINESN